MGQLLFNKKRHVEKKRFPSLKTLFKEPKLKEFQFKFMHRIIGRKRELFCYGILSNDNCIYSLFSHDVIIFLNYNFAIVLKF